MLFRAKAPTLEEPSDAVTNIGKQREDDRSQGTKRAHDTGDQLRIYSASGDNDSPTFVFIGHRRPESALWLVPDSDEDLIAGVGAYGTKSTKSDDTFESILFLNLGVED